MNTLEDLRATLAQHAEATDDTERETRAMAVRSRIRTARRRRAGGAVVAAVAALVIAAGTAGMVRGSGSPEPAGPTLDDVRVPERVDIYGFPYGLTETQRAAADGSVALEHPDGPAAVSLVATGLGSGSATLWSGPIPVARVRGDERVAVPVDGVVLTELRVELDGAPDAARAEVAVYEPTGELAPGVRSGDVVFRRQYADRELVAASFGEGGQTASAEIPDGTGDLDVSAYCHSATPDLWLQVDGTTGGMPCDDVDQGNDPGAANQNYLLAPRADDHTYGVHVTRGNGGPRATGVDVDFGFGVYRQAAAPQRVLGAEAATVLEANGRTWRLDDVLDADGGGDIEVDTSQGDAYIAIAYADALGMSVSWAGAPDGGWGGFRPGDEPQGPGVMYPGLLLAGTPAVRLDLTGPDAQARVLVYRSE